MPTIDTAVVPAGGSGTRFFPFTKSIPKEMLPLGNKPIVLHVVEELAAAGIKKIIFVVSHSKHSVEDFFTFNEAYTNLLEKQKRKKFLKEIKRIESLAEYEFVFTRPPYGNGGAILAAREILRDKPFILTWADEIIFTKKEPRALQCINAFKKYGKPVISSIQIKNPDKRCLYGMVKFKDFGEDEEVKEILEIVEKPKPGKEPSEYAAHGAYVLTPEFFDSYKKVKPVKGEIRITDLISHMKKNTGLLAKLIPDGDYIDCGDPESYASAQTKYYSEYSDRNF